MTSITKQKRLTLTERHEIVLRLDKGYPLTAIAKDYGVKKLTFTYLIILTMTSKIYFLRSGMRNTGFFLQSGFLDIFACKWGVKKTRFQL